NEEEARRVVEEELSQRREAIQRAKEEAVLGRAVSNRTDATTLFDVNVERRKVETLPVTPVKSPGGDLLDCQIDSPEAFGEFQSVTDEQVERPVSTVTPLNVLSSVVSRRGQARLEFGKVYATL